MALPASDMEAEPVTVTFFDPHQRATIEAAMARIIPTDDQPGAREAGTIDFLDRYLSGIGFIYAKPDGSGFETLGGQARRGLAAVASRSCARSIVEGVAELDRRSRADVRRRVHGAGAGAAGRRPRRRGARRRRSGLAPTGGPALQQTSAETELDFVPLLVMHTRQGFYADPIYGGNRDRVGWQVIGFPGPDSLDEVFTGRYSTLAWFAEGHDRSTAGAIVHG